jgi:hypothetical protein
VKFLVISLKHELHPFANRLMNEGHDVELIVWKQRYEDAWAGRLEPVARRSKHELTPELWEGYVKQAESGELTVLSNAHAVNSIFGDKVWGVLDSEPCQGEIRLGGWFDGEGIREPHLLVVDRGAWAGGLGPAVDGAMTLVNHHEIPAQFAETADVLVEYMSLNKFKGLFQVDYGLVDGAYVPERIQAGWAPLQAHAFFAERHVSDLLVKSPASPQTHARFVVAVPMSLPPWPNRDAAPAAQVPLNGLSQDQLGKVWWHDVQFDPANHRLQTAGLDGLLGIAIGSAHSFALAQGHALEVATTLGVAEKQYRLDAGQSVQAVLGLLEDRLGVRVG